MKWFYNMKISVKLLISFIIVLVMTGVIGVVGILNMGNLANMISVMYADNLSPITDLADANLAALDLDREVGSYITLDEKNAADVEKMNESKEAMNEFETIFKDKINDYKKSNIDDVEEQLLSKIDQEWVEYKKLMSQIMLLAEQGKDAESYLLFNGDFEKTFQMIDDNLTELRDDCEADAKTTDDTSDANVAQSRLILIVILAVCIAIGLFLAFFISNIISKPINKIVDVANKISDGDLDVNIEVNAKDETGMLAQAFVKMSDNLNEAMASINSSSEQVATGSRQVSMSGQALSQGSTEQASSIEEITSSMTQVAAQTKQNAVNANQANELAVVAKDNAVSGNQQMQEMLKAMAEINDSSSNISKIIKVIDEIAFQTNILALNAAVEAARAGQHGKGFAVVAEEVRNLAARSANAAKETTAMIEGSIKKVDMGTKIANETAQALNKIVNDVTKAAQLVGGIAAASNEQATGIAQVNTAIEQVAQVVQTNSATAEESAAASEELSGQAEMLKQVVAKFKLKKTGSSSGIGYDNLSPEVMRMIESMMEKKNNSNSAAKAMLEAAPVSHDSKLKINLTDKEFGKY